MTNPAPRRARWLARLKKLLLAAGVIVLLAGAYAYYRYHDELALYRARTAPERELPNDITRTVALPHAGGLWLPNLGTGGYTNIEHAFAVVGDTIVYDCAGGLAVLNWRSRELGVLYAGDTRVEYVVLAMTVADSTVYCATRSGIIAYDAMHNRITQVWAIGENGLQIGNNMEIAYDPWDKCLWLSGFVSFEKATIQRLRDGATQWEDLFDTVSRVSGSNTASVRSAFHVAPEGVVFPFESRTGGILLYERMNGTWRLLRDELAGRRATPVSRMYVAAAAYTGSQCWFQAGIDVGNVFGYEIVGYNMATGEVQRLGKRPGALPGLNELFPRLRGRLSVYWGNELLHDAMSGIDARERYSGYNSQAFYGFNGDHYLYAGSSSLGFFRADGQRLASLTGLRTIHSVEGATDSGTLLLSTSLGLEWFDRNRLQFTPIDIPGERYGGGSFWRVDGGFLCLWVNVPICCGETTWGSFFVADGATEAVAVAGAECPDRETFGIAGGRPAFRNWRNDRVYQYVDEEWRMSGDALRAGLPRLQTPGVRLTDAGLWLEQ